MEDSPQVGHTPSPAVGRTLNWSTAIPPDFPVHMHARLGACVFNGERRESHYQTPLAAAYLQGEQMDWALKFSILHLRLDCTLTQNSMQNPQNSDMTVFHSKIHLLP